MSDINGERRRAGLPPAPTELTPDEIRSLLRECVTVVKPGETLIIRVPVNATTSQVQQYQERLTAALESHGMPFRALVLPAEELGVAEPGNPLAERVRAMATSPRPGGRRG